MTAAPTPMPESFPPPTQPSEWSPPAPPVASAMSPVAPNERIALMDVLRGFAIFGIFMVNILLFAGPLRDMMDYAGPGPAWSSDQLVHQITRAFFEYKFVSLFSLLFGAGMIVQSVRAQNRGAAFRPVYLRRTLILMLIGLCHGLLIWYGDILFIYAITALILMWFHRAAPRKLIIAAVVFLSLSVLVIGIFGAAQAIFGQFQPASAQSQPAAPTTQSTMAASAPAAASGPDVVPSEVVETQPAQPGTFAAFAEAFKQIQGGPSDPGWDRAETIAFRDGPFLAALAMRALMFLSFLVFAVLIGGFAFRVIGLFLLGMALMKLGFFQRECHAWHKRAALLGLGLGVPGELMVVGTYHVFGPDAAWAVFGAEVLHHVASLALCFGYIGAWALIVYSGLLRPITAGLAAVGRMALSNYLMQSVVATGLMYWWGLGWFGDVTRTQQALIVVSIFACQVVISVLWLRIFAMGPLEWLWRSLTYWKRQPMLRSRASGTDAAMV